MKKLLTNIAFILLFFNTSLAQLEITQKGDNISLSNNTEFSTEVFVSEKSGDNFILRPGQSTIVPVEKYLTKKSLEEITISSSYTFSAYFSDIRLSFHEMQDKINNHQYSKKYSSEWMSIKELFENDEVASRNNLKKFISSLKLSESYEQYNELNYESFLQFTEEELIPNTDQQSLLVAGNKPFQKNKREAQMERLKRYIFNFLNTEIYTDDATEINYLADFFNSVKSFKRNYENNSIVDYGSLKDLGFKIFENSGDRFQLTFATSGLIQNLDSEEGGEFMYNLHPEIGIRTGRYRIGKNMMIENNLHLGYSYYAADKIDERIVINDVVNNIDEVYDKFHMATLGLDFIIKGGVQKPSLIGVGAEGGATYMISDTYNVTPDLELTPEADTDLGYYFGGFVMIGDKLNAKLGFRTYVLWYTPQDVDRNYLNTGLVRVSLSYRF